MTEQTDSQLLRAYAASRCEAAFGELVRRHVDLVHSAALRMVGEPHLAEDVAQGVFIALARNANQLAERAVLAGWLHRTAQNIAAQTIRSAARRRHREQEAATMNDLLAENGAEAPPAWSEIAPHLDDALGELSEADRDAILLRYFQKKSAADMAQVLGISDEAAQKRVSRAVERLRQFLGARGVTAGASGLAALISTNAVQGAPAGLALSISAAAVGHTAVSVATVALTSAATKTIAMTTLQKTFVTLTLAGAAGFGIYEARQAGQLREQLHTVQQQQAPLTEQVRQMEQDQAEATQRLSGLRAELASAKSNNLELMRLRNEVGLLRAQTNLFAKSQQAQEKAAANAPKAVDNTASRELILRENYEFAGYAAPESALKSLFWAATHADVQTLLASMSPALKAQTEADWAGKSEEEIKAELQKGTNDDTVHGYSITDTLVVSDKEVVLSIYLAGRNQTNKMRVIRTGDEWKIAGKPGK